MTQPQPAPSPSYQPPVQPHSHEKYLLAIIAVGIISLILGLVGGYGLGSNGGTLGSSSQPQPNFTWLHGTVDYGSGVTGKSILFDAQGAGTYSSSVFVDNTYQLYIPSGKTYTVTIYYLGASGTEQCPTARPSLITPTGSSDTENFFC